MTEKKSKDAPSGLFQYCVEPGCNYTERWPGGSAADDPAVDHLVKNPDHTVRSGAHLGHLRLMKLQQQGKMDHSRDVDPDRWRGEKPPVEVEA
jgi:hypothetical protein